MRPDITFLTGDQVYLDIGFDLLSRDPDEIRQRVADDYDDPFHRSNHSQEVRKMYSIAAARGCFQTITSIGTTTPSTIPARPQPLIPQLLALKLSSVRSAWSNAAKDAVKNIRLLRRICG